MIYLELGVLSHVHLGVHVHSPISRTQPGLVKTDSDESTSVVHGAISGSGTTMEHHYSTGVPLIPR